MRLTLAPMEGLTDAVYRQIHHTMFGGVNAYYIPFVTPNQNMVWHSRERNAIAPAVNQGIPVVPQVLCKDAALFLWAAASFRDMGYQEINLNLGCPSGTVTAKGKGSGMLRDTEKLRSFLETVCEKSPIPVSVKTRIGYADRREWDTLLPIYASLPLKEMIVHARVREAYYKGPVYPACYEAAVALCPFPVTYNGDLFTVSDVKTRFSASMPPASLMLGRGIFTNPALAREIRGGDALRLSELRAFEEALYDAYCQKYPANVVLGKMREITKYLSWCLEDADRDRRRMLKARSLGEYRDAVSVLFSSHPLKAVPSYMRENENQPWP